MYALCIQGRQEKPLFMRVVNIMISVIPFKNTLFSSSQLKTPSDLLEKAQTESFTNVTRVYFSVLNAEHFSERSCMIKGATRAGQW